MIYFIVQGYFLGESAMKIFSLYNITSNTAILKISIGVRDNFRDP